MNRCRSCMLAAALGLGVVTGLSAQEPGLYPGLAPSVYPPPPAGTYPPQQPAAAPQQPGQVAPVGRRRMPPQLAAPRKDGTRGGATHAAGGHTAQGRGQQPTGQGGSYGSAAETSQYAAPATPAVTVSGVAMVDALPEVNLETLRVRRQDVLDVRRALGDKQVQSLVQAVNGHGAAFQRAEQVADHLQARGLLRPGDRVVGVAHGKVYALFARR